MKKLLTLLGITLFSLLLVVGCAKNVTPPQDDGQKPPAAVDPDEIEVDPSVIDPAAPPVEPLDENDLTPTPAPKKKVHQLVLYFPDSDLMHTYRVKTEITVRENEQLRSEE